MTNEQIEISLGKLVRTERRLTGKILALINLADERKLYLERGYSSLFEWVTVHFGYSEPAASRRISAARLLKAVPQAAEKIESGAVNLTTLAKAHVAIRAQEKASGTKFTTGEKSEIVKTIEMKSAAQTERALVSLLPDAALQSERKTPVTADISRLAMNLSNETLQDLERVKELLSHVIPEGATFAEIIAYLAKDFLNRKDPLRKTTSAAAKLRVKRSGPTTSLTGRSIPAHVRREVLQRDRGRCQYEDEKTGRVCQSRYQIQLDHIYPKSLGGENTAQNLRCLCRKHNLHVAELILGSKSWSQVDRTRG